MVFSTAFERVLVVWFMRAISKMGIIDTDPIAARVQKILDERSSGTGSAADLLRVSMLGDSTKLAEKFIGRGKAADDVRNNKYRPDLVGDRAALHHGRKGCLWC